MTSLTEVAIRAVVSAIAAAAMLELVSVVVRLVLGHGTSDAESRAEMTGRLLPATQVVAALGGGSVAYLAQPALLPAVGASAAVLLVTAAVYASVARLRPLVILPTLGLVAGTFVGAAPYPVALGLALAFVGVSLLTRSAQLKRPADTRLARVSTLATASALGVLSLLVLRSDEMHLRIDLVALCILGSATLVRFDTTKKLTTADRLTVIATTTALSISLVLAPLVADHLTRVTPGDAASLAEDAARQRLFVRPTDPTAIIALAWRDTAASQYARAERRLRSVQGANEIDTLELSAELLAAKNQCAAARAKYDRALRLRTLARFERDVFERQLELGGYAMPTRLVHRCGLRDAASGTATDAAPTGAVTPP